MKFFRKLKEKLFSTSSKIKDGLEGIIDKQSVENLKEEQNKQDTLDKNLSLKLNENFEQKQGKISAQSKKLKSQSKKVKVNLKNLNPHLHLQKLI